MKNLYLLLTSIFVVSFALNTFSQGPEAINYQAVIRDANGNILNDEFLSVQFTIYSSPFGGEPLTMQYREAHDALTNEFGLVNASIGFGQFSFGVFANLQWGLDEYHLKTEVDLGNGWVDLGTQQLLSVPFAERADVAEDLAIDFWKQSGNDDVNDSFDFIGTTTSEELIFKTNNTEHMRVDVNGNLGIGTNNPGHPQDGLGFVGKMLHLEGAADENAVILMSEADGVTNGTNVTQITHADGNFYLRNHNPDGTLQMALGTGADPTMVITQDDVQIMNEGYSAILKVSAPTGTLSLVQMQNQQTGSTNNDGGLLEMIGNAMYLLNQESGNLICGTGGNNTLYISDDDFVGININTPVTELHVGTGTDASLSSHGYFMTGMVTGLNIVMDNNEIMARNDGNTSPLYLNGNGGNMAIGQTVSPSWLLTVNGTAAKPGGGSWTATSDSRLKQNVQPYTFGLDEVLQIEPVSYHYIEQTGHDTSVEHVGVIAQDLQKISPKMVNECEMEMLDGTKGEYLNVDPSAFTYMLINAVKELKAENEALKKRLDVLEEGR
ncbi:MAG: tail fiber domain-containing protein [Flavobacteriales bacterium]|nr:tail fiber domain-containing protein [Flavobacteriales bacterium]